ncbi:MAG: hypothetical protein HY925_06290, partial [Elusimicrobia bacterium]|nr:hypothetical protein [Elusimicrobiota bacterium]
SPAPAAAAPAAAAPPPPPATQKEWKTRLDAVRSAQQTADIARQNAENRLQAARSDQRRDEEKYRAAQRTAAPNLAELERKWRETRERELQAQITATVAQDENRKAGATVTSAYADYRKWLTEQARR